MRSSPQTPALSGAHRCTPECAALYGPLFQHCNVEAVRPPACYDAFGVTGAVFRAWLENANLFQRVVPITPNAWCAAEENPGLRHNTCPKAVEAERMTCVAQGLNEYEGANEFAGKVGRTVPCAPPRPGGAYAAFWLACSA